MPLRGPSKRRTAESISREVDLLYKVGNTKWDIGKPQNVVQQLVACGAIRGHVLDPGCGTGHHAVLYAEYGCTVTAVDSSNTALTYARHNARLAGVPQSIDFIQRDATLLDGVADGLFDTVVDSAFFHTFVGDPQLQIQYANTLARVVKAGGRLYIFGFAPGHINGYANPKYLTEADFHVFQEFDINYLGRSVYEVHVDNRAPQFRQLQDGRAHIPVWELHATRQ